MKNFLKISLVAVALLFTSTVSAQLLPISLGIKGGINVSNVSTEGYDSKNGFNAGLTADINLPAGFGIFSGLEVNTKGAQIKDGGGESKINAMYLQLPVRLGYRMSLLPGLRAHFGFGPYFAQGIGGKTKGFYNVIGGTSSTEDFEHDTFGDDGLKKFDWGLGGEVGVTLIGRIQVRAGYDFGLKNIAPSDADDKIKNRNFYVSAGLLFF